MKQIYRDNNSRANIYLITRVIYFRKPIKLQRVAASRSGDEPRPSLHKYNQNFKLNTFPISNKSRASPFLETAVGSSINSIPFVLCQILFDYDLMFQVLT